MDFRSSAIQDALALPNLEFIRLWLVEYREWLEECDEGCVRHPACREVVDQICRGILQKYLAVDHKVKLVHDLLGLGYSKLKLDGLFDGIREFLDEIKNMGLQMLVANSEKKVREAYAVVVAAVVLLSYVYLYLTGCGGWHGSRAVSSGSLDYRDTYIAIVLFRGAYVWIKFRDVASTKSKGVKLVTNGKYQLRFKPHRENGEEFDWIYIGRFDSQADADIVYRMIISCYGKDCGGLVDLAGDGRKLFPITPAFTLEEKRRVGKAKLDLVKKRVLEHYKRYKTEKDALNLPPTLPGASLEQELENRRLQSEILRERQQKEDLARQLQQYQSLLQAQMIQNQDLQRQVEGLQIEDLREPMTTAEIGSWMYELQGIDLQLQFQDPQAQQNLQQAQQLQIQNSELQVEDLQRPVQDQQIQQYLQHAQQCLQQAQQFQALELQPQPQPSSLQQHQREKELFTIDENCAVPIGTEPLPVVPGFGADIDECILMEPFQVEAGFGAASTNFWGGYPTDG
jgi:hypothetical protein